MESIFALPKEPEEEVMKNNIQKSVGALPDSASGQVGADEWPGNLLCLGLSLSICRVQN